VQKIDGNTFDNTEHDVVERSDSGEDKRIDNSMITQIRDFMDVRFFHDSIAVYTQSLCVYGFLATAKLIDVAFITS